MVAAVSRTFPVAPATTRPFGRVALGREAAFWLLQTLGWYAYFIANYFVALFWQGDGDAEKFAGYFHVVIGAAVSGFILSSLLRYAYREVRDRRPAIVIPTILVLVYVAALLWRL